MRSAHFALVCFLTYACNSGIYFHFAYYHGLWMVLDFTILHQNSVAFRAKSRS